MGTAAQAAGTTLACSRIPARSDMLAIIFNEPAGRSSSLRSEPFAAAAWQRADWNYPMKSTSQNSQVRLTPWNGAELDRLVGVLLDQTKTASSRTKRIPPLTGTSVAFLSAMRRTG